MSYLSQTDENRILLDVGLNVQRSNPSPLLHNMNMLGVSLDDIDTLVISHRHIDHVGGLPWLVRRTFSLGNEQLDLHEKRVFVPEPMTYPGVDTLCCREPTVIARGVATTGRSALRSTWDASTNRRSRSASKARGWSWSSGAGTNRCGGS